MTVAIPDFWKLIIDSRLLTPEQCHMLGSEFAGVKGAVAQANAKSLSQFLIARNALSNYQSTVILAGRSGPFFYGDYKVYDRVEQGRLAGLFRAIHVPTSHLAMLQFFTGPVTQDPNLWAGMAQQVLMHCGVVHPHLQRWHEPVDLTSFKFLVGEDLQGESLEQRLATCGVLPPQEACRVVRAVALGLAHLHQSGLVHGDVRPQNLWLEPSGHVKLLRDPSSTPTPIHLTPSDQANQLLIKSDYMAPELSQQGKTHDYLTDVYALGCTLYQLLSGRPPFPGGDVMQKLGRHANERIQPLESFGVPPQIGQAVAFMMAKNPAVRFQQASIVADQLAPFIDPAYLYMQPPPAAPTLASYETWVAQKQAALSGAPYAGYAPVAAPAQSEFPAVNVSRGRSPIGPPVSAPQFAAPQAAAPQLAGPQHGGPQFGGPQVFVAPVGPPGSAAVAPVVEKGPMAAPVLEKRTTVSDLHKDDLAELDHGFNNKKTRNLAIGLGIVAVLAIAAVIGINSMGSGKPKQGTGGEVADGTEEEGTEGDGNTTSGETPPKGVGTNNGKLPAGVPKEGNIPSTTVVTTETPGTTKNPGTTVVKNPGGVVKNPVVGTNPGTPKNPNPGTPKEPSGTANTGGPGKEVAISQNVVPDDGNLLWASPTSGTPIVLNYMPLGSQIFIVARPAEMQSSAEGARVLAALGPTFAAERAAWETASGFKFDEVEQIILGLYDNEGKTPRPAIAVHLKSQLPEADLLVRWGNPEPTTSGKGSIYTARGWSFHIPPTAGGKAFVMGSPPELEKVIEFNGAQPALRREIERLRAVSDSQRHFTALIAPNYLFNEEGQKLFSGEREKVLKALFWFLGDGLQGGSVSLHFAGETYAEVRLMAESGKQKFELAKEFNARLEQIPDAIENYIVDLNPPTYWKKVANRYPQMIRYLHQHTRVGVEDDQAVINAVLPANAGHNLFLASELVIASAPGAPTVVVAGPAKPETPKNINEVLAVKMNMAFAQDSLEFSMQNVVTQVKADYSSLPFEFKVILMGNDMKIDGITKNQSIRDFNEKDKTVAEILTAMVRKANPITTVKDASELDQKLIWVVGTDPDAPDKPCILVTTRAAAEKNGYKLPAPFVPKAN